MSFRTGRRVSFKAGRGRSVGTITKVANGKATSDRFPLDRPAPSELVEIGGRLVD